MDPYDNSVTLVPAPKPGLSRKTIFIGIGIIVALIITAILLLAANRGDNLRPFEQRLAIRMNNLQIMASSAQQNISNEGLVNINSQLNALVVSDNASIQGDLKALGAVADEYPEEMTTSESDASTYTELKQAVVDGDFDKQYVAAVTEKIGNTATLMNTIYQKSQDAKLRQDISKAYKNLQFVKKQMLKLKL